MQNALKILLIILGGMAIGFGLGMITADSFVPGEIEYWAITVVSLILGGFLMAMGLTKKEKKIDKKEEPSELK